MNPSPRKPIRDAVVALLRTPVEVEGQNVYPTPAGANVYPNRALPLECRSLPAILVYIARETRGEQAYNHLYYRELELTVEVRALGDDDLHDYMDDLAWLVEGLIMLDPSLGGLVEGDRTAYEGLDLVEEISGERVIGAGLINFKLQYLPPEQETPTDLSDFLRFRGHVDLPPADGRIDHTIAVNFPEED